MNDILILHTLLKYDCTMYTINKIVQSIFFAYSKPSFGSLNPAVKRLIKNGYIKEEEKMSQGGKRSNLLSITSSGEKFLKDELLKIKFVNPSNFLNSASIALMCDNVLNAEETADFKKNLSYEIKIYKKYVNDKLNSPYNNMSENQKQIANLALLQAEKLEALCQ
jgi:DNA-binding PadR family transcriptional regulator